MPRTPVTARHREELFFNRWKFYPAKTLEHGAFRTIGAPALDGIILDIGGGLGPYREYLSASRYISMEINPSLRPHIVGSASELPVRTNAIDSALCNEVLEHLPEPAAAVREIYRVLRPGGRVYVTVPFLWCLHYEPHDYYRFTGHALRNMLETEGFTILRLEPVGRVFSYLATRLAEKWFTFARKFFFFLPKRERAYASFPFIAPVTWILYALARLLDLTNRRDVFFFAVLAEKPETK
jgi:SAM-dependent methyltransferase